MTMYLYLLPVAVFPVTLRAAETGGGLCVVLAGASCTIVFITRVGMSITLTSGRERMKHRMLMPIVSERSGIVYSQKKGNSAHSLNKQYEDILHYNGHSVERIPLHITGLGIEL